MTRLLERGCVSYFGSLLAIVGHLFDGHHLVGVQVTGLEKKDRSDQGEVYKNIRAGNSHTYVYSNHLVTKSPGNYSIKRTRHE